MRWFASDLLDLQVSTRDRSKEHAAFHCAQIVFERHAVAVAQVQRGGVLGIHEHRIARRASEQV